MNKEDELRILRNFIRQKPIIYGVKTQNWVVVMDILLSGTSTGGRTSCIKKCIELGIDPYGHKCEVLK